jgi:hypothetical protein
MKRPLIFHWCLYVPRTVCPRIVFRVILEAKSDCMCDCQLATCCDVAFCVAGSTCSGALSAVRTPDMSSQPARAPIRVKQPENRWTGRNYINLRLECFTKNFRAILIAICVVRVQRRLTTMPYMHFCAQLATLRTYRRAKVTEKAETHIMSGTVSLSDNLNRTVFGVLSSSARKWPPEHSRCYKRTLLHLGAFIYVMLCYDCEAYSEQILYM